METKQRPPRPSFRAYVKARPATDDIRDDFAQDFRGEDAPVIRSGIALIGYLRERNACPEAIEAAKLVWREYELKLAALGHLKP